VQSSGIGGFAGYNFQWEDVVGGVELNYTHGKFDNSSSGSQGRTFFFPTNYYTTANITSTSSMRITDFGSLRVRGGYAVGNLLPYMFAGVALGQADITRTARADLFYQYVGTATPPLPNLGPFSDSLSDNAHSHFVYGFSTGLGIDMMLFSNIFLRGEWEFLRLIAPVDTVVNTVRAGVGYKF
jgi:outer membrane immunogenic protein